MQDRTASSKPIKHDPKHEPKEIEAKPRISAKPKVKILYPESKREFSPELYFPTDRHRLSEPLFPNLQSIEVREPR